MERFLLLLWTLVIITSCGDPVLVDEEKALSASGWAAGDTLTWSFDIPDTMAIYRLLLTVDHQRDYRYQNCYVRFHTGFPDGTSTQQIVSLDLQSPSGLWHGDCGRSRCQLTIPIQEKAYFRTPGLHTLKLEPWMRMDTITGIRAFRLRIEDSGNRRTAG